MFMMSIVLCITYAGEGASKLSFVVDQINTLHGNLLHVDKEVYGLIVMKLWGSLPSALKIKWGC